MAVKLGLWSLTLVPGETYPIYVKHDFQVTNAALTEELASADGRTVLKVSHIRVNPAIYGDSDSDSEIDSDLADSDLDDEDQFELDEQEGFKEVEKKASKANGVADVSMEQEEDDEEEEDSDEDDEFSDMGGEEVTSVICALTGGRIEQATLNLTFNEGDAIMFEVVGENAIHLMGNYIDQPNQYDSDDEHDHEHDDYDEMFDGESDSDDEEGAAFIEALKEPEPKAKKSIAAPTPAAAEAKPKKAAAAPTPAPAAAAPADKKRKAEAIDSPAAKPAAAAGAAGETLSKAQKKKLNKKAKTEEAPAAAAAAAKPEVASAKAAGVKRTLPSGLIIEDIKKGDGPAAKGGKRLSMRYIGKLTDGKQFDANTAGKPFSFVLGRGEVIKGWDEGLLGMNVGGERRLTIPAQLAYGSQKIPGIPKNSTLKFEVKLLAVN